VLVIGPVASYIVVIRIDDDIGVVNRAFDGFSFLIFGLYACL